MLCLHSLPSSIPWTRLMVIIAKGIVPDSQRKRCNLLLSLSQTSKRSPFCFLLTSNRVRTRSGAAHDECAKWNTWWHGLCSKMRPPPRMKVETLWVLANKNLFQNILDWVEGLKRFSHQVCNPEHRQTYRCFTPDKLPCYLLLVFHKHYGKGHKCNNDQRKCPWDTHHQFSINPQFSNEKICLRWTQAQKEPQNQMVFSTKLHRQVFLRERCTDFTFLFWKIRFLF